MKRHATIDVMALLERIKAAGPDAPVSRAEATALIASRTMKNGDTLRSARNRVGVQLSRAIIAERAGQDVFSGGISLRPDGNFTADEFGRWANRRYSNKFMDMPRRARVCDCDCRENVGFGAKPSTVLLPGDTPRLQAMVLQLLADIEEAKLKERKATEARNKALGARFTQSKE